MKANELKKVSVSIDEIYNAIQESNNDKRFRVTLNSDVYISDEVIAQLIEDGFIVKCKGHYIEW